MSEARFEVYDDVAALADREFIDARSERSDSGFLVFVFGSDGRRIGRMCITVSHGRGTCFAGFVGSIIRVFLVSVLEEM